jgi:hypothetical protein
MRFAGFLMVFVALFFSQILMANAQSFEAGI